MLFRIRSLCKEKGYSMQFNQNEFTDPHKSYSIKVMAEGKNHLQTFHDEFANACEDKAVEWMYEQERLNEERNARTAVGEYVSRGE